MVDALADDILAEIALRDVIQRVDYRVGAFAEQIAFLDDEDQFKIGHCSRGAAKSYTAGIGIYEFMEKFPGTSCFYVTKTHDMARNIMWANVMKAIGYGFGVMRPEDFNETLLEGRHPNGSTFRLTGIDGDRKQQDKLLGGKYKLVVLDEVAFFETDLSEIINRTLVPAVGRIGGSIWMMSTSSDFPRGLFYEATRPEKNLRIKGWSVHEWQWSDNPYVKIEMQKTIDKLVEANPLIVETNHFKQHYLNEWVIDESKLCYRFNDDRNFIAELPDKLNPDGWFYVLGIDTGWEDDNAFVLTAYHLNDPNLYVLHCYKEKRLTFDQVVIRINEFMTHPTWKPHKVFIDGANKQGVESMRARSHIPFEYAEKQDKATFIELLNADLVQAKIKVHDTPANRALAEELKTLVWVTEGEHIKFPKKEHPAIPNHLADAFLYAWRCGYHYQAEPMKPKVIMGSADWYKQQADNIWEREREMLIEQERGSFDSDLADFSRF